jgi:hypothetical protein
MTSPSGAPLGTYIEPLYRCEHDDPRTGDRCTSAQISTSRFCVIHAPSDELDLQRFTASRIAQAKYKLAAALPHVTDELIRTATLDDEPGATRVRAIEVIYNRSGLPAEAAHTVQADITVTTRTDIREQMLSAIDRLARRAAAIEPDDPDLPAPPPPATPAAITTTTDALVSRVLHETARHTSPDPDPNPTPPPDEPDTDTDTEDEDVW